MKLNFSLILLFLFPLCGIAQYNWSALSNAPKSYRCDDLFFLNPQLGWVINPNYSNINPPQYGRIFKTTDGGNSWQLLKDSSVSYYRCVGFADTLTGWIGNLAPQSTSDTFVLNETTDGGTTWHQANLPQPHPAGICGISVVNDSVVYAYGRFYGPAGYLKTTNKGISWVFKDMTTYAGGLVDGYFFSSDTGFITGRGSDMKGLILYTSDGGNSWSEVYHSTRNDSDIVWKLSFPGGNTGYASVEYTGSYNIAYSTVFLKTTDKGNTWVEYPFIGTYDEEGIGFINDSVGWIGGDEMKPNYKTSDGGNTWNVDTGFGIIIPQYDTINSMFISGFAINRFRRFSDTLIYASGNTIYKLNAHTATGIKQLPGQILNVYNYPNPFNELTTIKYSLPVASQHVTIDVRGLTGGGVFFINVGAQSQGDHEYIFERHLPAGLYEYTVTSENFTATKKMVIIH